MSRLLLLLIVALWLLGSTAGMPPSWGLWAGLGVFFGGYALLVLGMGVWARLLAGQVDHRVLSANLNRFNRVMNAARAGVPLWLGFGLFGPIGWAERVHEWLDPIALVNIAGPAAPLARLALPGALLGTLPAMLAWIGLWWAQYPADRALREQSLLNQLEGNLPVHAPPSFWQWLVANIRQQLLFIFLPIVLILLMRDLAFVGLRAAGVQLARVDDFENWIMLPAAGMVFVFAPELLRRVLLAQRLPDSPLRQRLEEICRRVGLRYRDILLWNTEHSMGNAAVMGLVPQVRYILLSDLLLETLTDQQIEAVFAHEVGHVVHRHMAWYVVFFSLLTLAALGPGHYVEQWAMGATAGQAVAASMAPLSAPQRIFEIGSSIVGLGGMLLVFGYLSRRFERQADVFAARMIQSDWGATASCRGHVGQHGAAVFASALHRVALINNIPVAARSWCHGSIAKRMGYLEELAADPARTGAFDRFMMRLYATLLLALAACGVMAAC